MALWCAVRDIKESKGLTVEERHSFLAELDWLRGQDLVQTYTLGKDNMNGLSFNTNLEEDIKALHEDIQGHLIPAENRSCLNQENCNL